MNLVEKPADPQPDEPQLWRTMPPLPDEVVDRLRLLLFPPTNQNRQTKPSS